MTAALINGIVKPKSITAGDTSDAANFTRIMFQPVTADIFEVSHTGWKEWDTLTAGLPAADTGTYLHLVTGTYGSGPPYIQSNDAHSGGTSTRRARQILQLDHTYISAGQLTLQIIAGMKTTIADTSATILVEAYQLLDDGTLSANLGPAAQSINSLTLASLNFAITATGLAPGSRLDVRVTMTIIDAATGTAVIGQWLRTQLLQNVQP